jgi:hypothetical protein
MVLRGVVIAMVLFGLGACDQGGGANDAASGVSGVVLAGPQCPVETVESPCPDRPLPDVSVRVIGSDGRTVAEGRTDGTGHFSLDVAPGTYTAQAVVEPAGPTSAKPEQVTVSPAQFAEVTLTVDTGIR